jgi:acyl-CoA reductase-like NAD-dependent aldehyde dehydrogenase
MALMKQTEDRRLPIAGEWIETGEWAEVRNPYDDAVVARVPVTDEATVDCAIGHAAATFARGAMPQWKRAEVLDATAHLIREHEDELAEILALEGGKPLQTAKVETARAFQTFTFSAVEARKLAGEQIPLGATPTGEGKIGLTLRVPLGVVVAISPFNFPLNLVAHKIGPALAAGNAVVVKPAVNTPLSALRLAELMQEAGLPDGWLQIVCGPGGTIGDALVRDDRVAAVTFTGSVDVGWGIRAAAPRKKVTLELGSSSPVIVHRDADWERAADRCAANAYMYAGQTCISVQRLLLHDAIADRFLERFARRSEQLIVGDPMSRHTDVGPMIDATNRDRVREWVERAEAAGATLVLGGGENPDGTLQPTILDATPADQPVWCDEVFGPVAAARRYRNFADALEQANGTRYGLQAGVFTADIGLALQAVHALEFGGVLVNEVPSFRADQQPYGGVKDSGNTREGPAYAIRELSEDRFVSLQ